MISAGMDRTSLIVLPAASHVLTEQHPVADQVKILTDCAREPSSQTRRSPADELAMIVALKLKGADVAQGLV